MRIAIFGSGGVGGYFGGRLAQAGETVFFIARGEHLRALQGSGLSIESIKGNLHLQPIQATDDPSQVGAVDIVLLAVKAWQAPEAIRSMHPLIGENTGVVPLGNGIEAPGLLREAFGDRHAMGGLCRISSFITSPGVIRHVGIDPLVICGELDNRRSSRLAALREAFERAGVNVIVPEDIQVAMWEKFIFIAAVSGIGAITRSPTGVFRSLPETRRILAGLITETEQVGRQQGVNLLPDIAARTLSFIDNLPYETHASMVRDILAGKPSELEAQNGAVVRLGEMASIPSPFNQFVYACLLPQELRVRGEL